MSWRRPTSTQAPELGEELYSWGDTNCSASFSCLLSETGMVQLHHHRHSDHEQDNGSEAKRRTSMSPQLWCKLFPWTNQITLAETGLKRDLTQALSYSCICASTKPQEGSTGMGTF